MIEAMRSGLAGLIIFISCVVIVVSLTQSERPVDEEATTPERPALREPPAELRGDNFALAEYYFNQNTALDGPYDIGLARYYYLEAAKVEPVPSTLWYQLGRIDFVLGNFARSREHLMKQLELFGDELPQTYYVLGLTNGYEALETNDPELWRMAEDAFITYINYAPESPWPRVDLAWVYFSQGKYEAMIPPLEAALEYNPDHAWVLNSYGLALMNLGETAAAHEQFKRAKAAAARVTVEEWGAAYSANNPAEWETGLAEFRNIIDGNVALTE